FSTSIFHGKCRRKIIPSLGLYQNTGIGSCICSGSGDTSNVILLVFLHSNTKSTHPINLEYCIGNLWIGHCSLCINVVALSAHCNWVYQIGCRSEERRVGKECRCRWER